MASIGALLLLGALATYVFTRPGKSNDEFSLVDDQNESRDESIEQPDQSSLDPALPDTGDESGEPFELASSGDPPPETEDPNEFDPEPMDAPPIDGIPDVPPEIATTGSHDPNSPPEGFGDEPEMASTSEGNANETENTDTTTDESGTVKAILAESGTSILKIQNAASIVRNDFAIGTPRYFFEKVNFKQANPTKQKDQKLLRVNYNQQSLQTVLHELSAISGLRLTIDAPSIGIASGNFNPKVELQLENETTGAVVRKVAESVGLIAKETNRGYLITAEQKAAFEDGSINVALLIENEKDGAALPNLIRKMVWPGTWKADNNANDDPTQADARGSCKFREGKLELNHTPAAIAEAQRLIDGLKAAAGSKIGGSGLLKPVPWIDANSFAKPFNKQNSVRVPLGRFFRSFLDNYDVQIIADWHSLGGTGWTSDAMAPSRIEEATIGDVVRETAHGLGASIYVVDERTVWITSPDIANNIFLLRVYPLGGIANGRLSAERIERVLAESLGTQIGQPGVAFSWLPKQKVMVVRAPQMLHRQVHAVLGQLE